MIHSLSGGIIADYDTLIYALVLLQDGLDAGQKRWFLSPFPAVKAGDKVRVPCGIGGRICLGEVVRVEFVTKQTAPNPVNRTREIEGILNN